MFYWGDDWTNFLKIQLIGILAIILWAGFWGWLFFFTCKKLNLLRVRIADEILGLDIAEHDHVQDIDMKSAKDIVERLYSW